MRSVLETKAKKGNLGILVPSILSLILAAAILVFGLVITEKLRDTTTGSDSNTAANKTIEGLGSFADFWEIIVLAVVITIVIGLLLVVFSGRKAK